MASTTTTTTSPSSPPPNETDVLIIGAGPAGLSCATVLSRLLWRTVIFDSGVFRYAASPHFHMVPGYDHQSLLSYIDAIRAPLETRYGSNKFVSAKAVGVERIEGEGQWKGWFRVRDEKGGVWVGRKLVLAMGNVEKFPELPGYEDCWIKGIFHCQVHRGYEVAGCAMAGVLAVEGDGTLFKARHLALEAKALAQRVTIFTHGNEALATEVRDALATWPEGLYTVDSRRIAKLEKGEEGSDVLIHFEDKDTEATKVNYIIHRPIPLLPSTIPSQLGLEIDNSGIINPGFIKVQGLFNETTNVPGCFAIGDCASAFKVVVAGVSGGAFCAAGIAAQLGGEVGSRHGFACEA